MLPYDFSVKRLLRRLPPDIVLEVEAEAHTPSCFYDSFDWRLFAAEIALQRVAIDPPLLLLSNLKMRQTEAVLTEQIPAWPAQLIDPGLRAQLASILDMRVLLPQVYVDTHITQLRMLNEDGKTVVRLHLEAPSCHREADIKDDEERRNLLPRLWLLPIRGYADAAIRLADMLRGQFELPDAPFSVVEEAVAAIGGEVGGYSSKLNIHLHPSMTAAKAMRRILAHLLATLEANVDGTRRDLDSEFLHDLRVATRRTRSAIGQVRGALPPAVVEDFRTRFAWLGQVTGPTRDLDVFLLGFDGYRATLPEGMREHLAPLHTYLRGAQKREQVALRKRLAAPHFRKLLKDWHAFLASECEGENGELAGLPVTAVAGRRIWRMYRRVLHEGRAITADSRHEELHELRKSCKKLRYLIEFFGSLYPSKRLNPLLKALKRLLDNLGDFQDLEVQAGHLVQYGEDMQAKGEANADALIAIGVLVGNLLRGQADARVLFDTRFADFDTPANRASYRQLFKPAAHGESE